MTRGLLTICGAHPHDEGATAVEYAIVASLIAGVVAAAVGLLGFGVLGLFNDVIDAWP